MNKALSVRVSEKFFQYELMTAVYVMEPWEKMVFNTMILLILSLSFTTLYQYTPVMLGKLVPWF